MAIKTKGMLTGFQDSDGSDIRVGDRIKSLRDGSICTIDKYCCAVSALNFKYNLQSMQPIHRGMNEDGTYFAKLLGWRLTKEKPAKVVGETVKLGDDAENMAPPRVHDPRNESLRKENWKKNRNRPADEVEEAARDLVDAVERFLMQGLSRRVLVSRKDKLKRLLESKWEERDEDE